MSMINDGSHDAALAKWLEKNENTSVFKPDYYKGKKLWVDEVVDDFNLNFNRGNVLKYLVRAGKKNGRATPDLMKALYYLKAEILKARVEDESHFKK